MSESNIEFLQPGMHIYQPPKAHTWRVEFELFQDYSGRGYDSVGIREAFFSTVSRDHTDASQVFALHFKDMPYTRAEVRSLNYLGPYLPL